LFNSFMATLKCPVATDFQPKLYLYLYLIYLRIICHMFSFCSTKGEITFISLTSGSFLECKYLVFSLSPSLSYTHTHTHTHTHTQTQTLLHRHTHTHTHTLQHSFFQVCV